MQKNTYNGWYNYETWLFNLHYDDMFHDDAQECWDDAEACDTFTREENAAFELSDRIENWSEEVNGEEKLSLFLSDLVRSALQEINFLEIAKHYINEVDREEEAA